VAKSWNEDAAIRGALRRVFSRSPVIREVLTRVRREIPRYNKDGSRAKKDAVQYLCNVCNEYVGSTKIAVDHISPVVSVEDGFIDLNTFRERLFCNASNLQVICDECHNAKTQEERIKRLLKQYTAELAEIEQDLQNNGDRKKAGLLLKKYIAKKKTVGLEKIVEQALSIKKNFSL
jgi:5-methylcytosine-specific restriction endonuclease McrA